MKIDIKEFLLSGLVDSVRKLGIVGTISYVGASTIFVVLLFTNFNAEPVKAVVLLTIGVVYYCIQEQSIGLKQSKKPRK